MNVLKKPDLILLRLQMLKDGYEHAAIDNFVHGVVQYNSLAHSKIEKQRSEIKKESGTANELDFVDMELDDEHYFLDEAKKLAHELSIIALYKKVEITVGRAVKIAYPEAPDGSFSKIDKLKRFLETKGIIIENISGYDGMDETRLINNAIKHSGSVSEELDKISGWEKGKPIGELDIAYQRLAPLCEDYVESLLTDIIDNRKKVLNSTK